MMMRIWSPRLCAALMLVASAAIASSAFAQPQINSVISCQSISKSGFYELDQAISPSTPSDCIVITAPNVTLNLNQEEISGAGGGTGIHVMRTAANVFIEGGGATISNFIEGIEIDAANAVAENFTVSGNGDAGVYLNGAKQAKVSNFTANGNNKDGVRLFKASMNVIQGFSAANNGRYGVWLMASSRNTIDLGDLYIQDNSIAGIYLGCWSAGPNGQACKPKVAPSSYNSIFDGYTDGASGGQNYGIAIDLGDNFNKVAHMSAIGNTDADVVDYNTECGNNLWISVEYAKPSSPSPCAQ
jgi:hypothetical protein